MVRRYTNLVYSVAKRRLSNVTLAQEVTQIVFIRLAKTVPQLRGDAALVAWLHRTTVHVSIDLWRSETRRRVREEQAVAMQLAPHENTGWNELAPVVDEALNELNEADRQTLLLRFFEGKTMRDLGVVFGVSEDAAKMRVSRAINRLRGQLGVRGMTCSAMGLGTMLSDRSVEAAPNSLAASLASLSLPVPLGATAGFFSLLVNVSKTKLVAGLAAAALVGVTTFMLIRSPQRAGQVAITDASQPTATPAEQNQPSAASATQDANAADGQREPDPRNLLLAVAQARQRIVSGSLEFQLSVEHFGPGRRETNHIRLAALFDGSKLRYEQFEREYSYKYSADEAEQDEIKKRADSMDREAAVRAGLLRSFESHYTMAYDGVGLLKYTETDGKPSGTTIDDPGKGASQFIFDPRCLGLRTSMSVNRTVESCLGYRDAKSLNLIGQELVEGVPAWHVHLQSKYDESLDFWVAVAHPDRLLKHAKGRDVVVSKYEDAASIPTEVTTLEYLNGSPWGGIRFSRSKAQFNEPVDPSSFTLAGLGMQLGTPVVDIRIHRGIGVWTGVGLAADLPPKTGTEPPPPPKLAEMLAVLENYPASPDALDAAGWILLNTPDGPEVEKAAEVILREHTRDTNLVHLCKELERVRHRCSQPLLETILKNNPSAEVRGTACFSLATMFKDEAKYGQNQQATAQAEKHFERVITDFGQIKERWNTLEDLAKPELSELRRLTIGKPAPEIEGQDLDGRPMKLSDYRGQVVVLAFWWSGYSEATEHRKLVERMAGKPFAFIGVYNDDDLTKGKAVVEKNGIIWPSFRDKRDGPISTNWNVRSWPNIWVLDSQGVIRYRGVRGRELVDAVDTLLRE